MKKNYLLLSFSLFSVLGIMNAQQVGINTSNPTKMLDVNGNARIRNIPMDNTSTNLIVADNQGNLGSISKTSIVASEIDGVIGNEVTTANNGLQITGSGTTLSPLTVGLGGTLSSSTGISMNGNNLNFTGSGNIGIGTNNPTEKLDINGGTAKLSALGFNTGENYRSVVSDKNGKLYTFANTSAASLPTLTSQPGEGITYGSGIRLNYNNFNSWNNTGIRITIPAKSTYIVNVTMLIKPQNRIASDQSIFIRSTFMPVSSSQILTYSPGSYGIVGGKYVSGLAHANTNYGVMNGSVILRNDTSQDQTFSYMAGLVEVVGDVVTISIDSFGSNSWNENNIYAMPINSK